MHIHNQHFRQSIQICKICTLVFLGVFDITNRDPKLRLSKFYTGYYLNKPKRITAGTFMYETFLWRFPQSICICT